MRQRPSPTGATVLYGTSGRGLPRVLVHGSFSGACSISRFTSRRGRPRAAFRRGTREAERRLAARDRRLGRSFEHRLVNEARKRGSDERHDPE